jgi:hypothetical protein
VQELAAELGEPQTKLYRHIEHEDLVTINVLIGYFTPDPRKE